MTEDQRLYFTDQLKFYDTAFKIDKEKFINCYSKKQLNAISPIEDRKFLGEYAKNSRKEQVAQFSASEYAFPMYEHKSHDRFSFVEKGYLKCSNTENSYIVLLKDVLWLKLLIIFLTLLLIGGAIYTATNWDKTGEAPRDITASPPPGEDGEPIPPAPDPNARNIQNQAGSEKSKPKNELQVSAIPTLKMTAGTTTPGVTPALQNKNPDFNAVITLIVNGEEIGKTGAIGSGMEVREMRLYKVLAKGTYPAQLKYEFTKVDGTKGNPVTLNTKIEAT
jgi:hypothetical protein